MIELHTIGRAELREGQTLVARINYEDGTFDIVAAVYDTKSGSKFVRVFPSEPGDHHLTRANAWLESDGLSSTVRTEG